MLPATRKPFTDRHGAEKILGINARNLDYILRYNRRKHFVYADDKIKTKELMQGHIPTPEKYAVIEFQHEVKNFRDIIAPYESFVVKPSNGSGGGGIIVVQAKTNFGYRKNSEAIISEQDLRYHMQNILSGMYSLGGQTDRILIERPVEFSPVFKHIAYQGVPDIRVIVYRGVPAIAMLRLPTKQSDGKANLHAGGIGAGIHLRDGVTTTAIQSGQYITHHPETGHAVIGHEIPYWQQILEIGAKLYDLSGLGYLGVDIVLDKQFGPQLLEINARPGIAIQIANRRGLATLLSRIDSQITEGMTIEERIRLGIESFIA